MGKRRIALTIFLVMLVFVGCGKKKSTGPTPEKDPLEVWNAHCAIQLEAWAVFDSVAATGDTTSAITATISFLESFDQVDWAIYNGFNGISIAYKDGGAGGIMIYASSLQSRSLQGFNALRKPREGIIPTKEGAIFCDPFFVPLHSFHEPIYSTMCDELPKVDFPVPGAVTDWGVTPSTLAQLSNMGAINLKSHGWPHPSLSNLQEVWYVLTIPFNKEINKSFKDDLNKHLHPVLLPKKYVVGSETDYFTYGVAPEFIYKYNHDNWKESKPLVWGGFCLSFLGNWPQTMVDAGVSCYVGWDWVVSSELERDYACKFYEFMCDTPTTSPFATTVAAYFCYIEQPQFVYRGHPVHLCWAGDGLTSFQEMVESGWRVGPHRPTFEAAVAGWSETQDEIDIVLGSTTPDGSTAGIRVANASELQAYSPVIPEFAFCLIPGVGWFSNLYWESMRDARPCYVQITEIELELFGKVSGSIWGYFYEVEDTTQTPVPIYGSFENVAFINEY